MSHPRSRNWVVSVNESCLVPVSAIAMPPIPYPSKPPALHQQLRRSVLARLYVHVLSRSGYEVCWQLKSSLLQQLQSLLPRYCHFPSLHLTLKNIGLPSWENLCCSLPYNLADPIWFSLLLPTSPSLSPPLAKDHPAMHVLLVPHMNSDRRLHLSLPISQNHVQWQERWDRTAYLRCTELTR